MCENILLISEELENIQYIKTKLLLLRRSDKVGSLSLQRFKKSLENQSYDIVLIDESCYNRESILKTVEIIKNNSYSTEIILINSNETDDFITECYDRGVSNCVKYDSQKYEYMMAVLNSIKISALRDKITILEAFLQNTPSVLPKNDLITHKALKESFSALTENSKIRNGIFAVVTLDDNTKTKVSVNRLAGVLKKNLRDTDIIASALGYFYIVLGNVDLNGAKSVIEKIDQKMGEDVQVRAGLSKIGKNDYDSVEKQAKDSLKSAINNEQVCVVLGDNVDNAREWLSDDGKTKHFKLFQVAFDKKLKSIIEPNFFRFEKECMTKIPECIVNQYANRIECNFTLKKGDNRSELIIRHDGYAKIKVKIVHYGLETLENTDEVYDLTNFSEREILKLLKQLKNEFMEGFKDA